MNSKLNESSEILFINVIHPKKGKLKEFAAVQVEDFRTYGSGLDGSISNEFYVSVNEGDDGHCVNVARFKDLESYYAGTSTDVFKSHIQRIQPLLAGAEPRLLQKIYTSSSSEKEDIPLIFDEEIRDLMKDDDFLQKKFPRRRIINT